MRSKLRNKYIPTMFEQMIDLINQFDSDGDGVPDIMAFNKRGDAVGYVGDEFGATGVYILKPYQRRGLGLELLTEYSEQIPKERRLGQMTPSGELLARAFYKKRR